MQKTRIGLLRAALFGCLFGVAYTLATNFAELGQLNAAFMIGLFVGGAIAGSFLFVIVAAIINFFRKS